MPHAIIRGIRNNPWNLSSSFFILHFSFFSTRITADKKSSLRSWRLSVLAVKFSTPRRKGTKAQRKISADLRILRPVCSMLRSQGSFVSSSGKLWTVSSFKRENPFDKKIIREFPCKSYAVKGIILKERKMEISTNNENLLFYLNEMKGRKVRRFF